MGRQDRVYRSGASRSGHADELDDIRLDKGKKKRRPWGRKEGRRDRQAEEREADVTDGEHEARQPSSKEDYSS